MRLAWYSTLKGPAAEMAKYALDKVVKTHNKDGHAIATFAGGCFWGLELAYQRVHGVVGTGVGYTQGEVVQPTYEEVCEDDTGHAEAVQVFYDPKEVAYERLLDLYFKRVDPTQLNRQGNDWGTRYRSGIYFHTTEQHQAAVLSRDKAQLRYRNPIVIEIKPATIFYPAESHHQQYLENGGRWGSPQSASKGCTDAIRCYG